MASYSGNITFSLPNDINSNQILIHSSTTESGVYSLDTTKTYSYLVAYLPFVIDDSKWYKIAFKNSSTGTQSPFSDALSGSGYLASKPTFSLSDKEDGVAFATVNDVYRKSHLTTSNVSQDEVQYCIDTARAYIDNLTSTSNIDRYNVVWEDSPSRRKYNATLKLFKEIEINLATSIVYKNLADDKLLQNSISNTKTSTSVSVGQTSIGGISGPDSVDTVAFLDSLSQRYANYANSLLSTILPTYVPIRCSENGTGYGNRNKYGIFGYLRLI